MADLDELIGSMISLISQQDVRYQGVLYTISTKESSIVLRDGMFCIAVVTYRLCAMCVVLLSL